MIEIGFFGKSGFTHAENKLSLKFADPMPGQTVIPIKKNVVQKIYQYQKLLGISILNTIYLPITLINSNKLLRPALPTQNPKCKNRLTRKPNYV